MLCFSYIDRMANANCIEGCTEITGPVLASCFTAAIELTIGYTALEFDDVMIVFRKSNGSYRIVEKQAEDFRVFIEPPNDIPDADEWFNETSGYYTVEVLEGTTGIAQEIYNDLALTSTSDTCLTFRVQDHAESAVISSYSFTW